ncbi:hypothetical protein BBJ28_00017826 [Nothophytophthora sp. Chile5]|nr:hypothetical protein BBJ28_00017826 [Nothophytophthora sp. Chile5]
MRSGGEGFQSASQIWIKGKAVPVFHTSAALSYMIETVLENDINTTVIQEDGGNSQYQDWQLQFIFGAIPLSPYWQYRRMNDPKTAEATLIPLCQPLDVVEKVQELKYSFVAKDGSVNLLFLSVLVVALQAAFALITSGFWRCVSVQPAPNQSGSQMSKWQSYYGIMVFVGVVLSLLTVDNLRRKTIFKDVLPFSVLLSIAVGVLGIPNL